MQSWISRATDNYNTGLLYRLRTNVIADKRDSNYVKYFNRLMTLIKYARA